MNETYRNHLRNKEEQLLSLTSNVDAISETVDSYQQINLELRTRIEQFQAEIAGSQQTLDGEQVKLRRRTYFNPKGQRAKGLEGD